MLGLSTSWISETVRDVGQWLFQVDLVGASCLELEYRVPHSFFRKLRPKLKEKGFTILSVHNFFPFPDEYSHLKPSGDLFQLSGSDREERETAVKYAKKTIEAAEDLACSAVVLHLGKVEMDSYFSTFCRFFDEGKTGSPAMETFVAAVLAERAEKRPVSLDAVCFSLDQLIREAERRSVSLGIENRYYVHEIPSCEEMGIILDRFAGAPVFHWHDVGHGFVHEQFGVQRHEEWFERYGDKLLGVHIHDANGYKDHQAIGSGTVDFAWIKPYLKPETVKIVELHPNAAPEGVKESFSRLREMGIV